MTNNKSNNKSTPTETTSLIFKSGQISSDVELKDLSVSDYLEECWSIYQKSIPVVLGSLIQKMIGYVSVFFIGQYLGKYEMAAASLSNMFAIITGWSLTQSMDNVLNTVCSQAFTGSSDVYLVGIYLQRGILITLTMFIPIGMVWWNAENILTSMNIDAQLASMCGTFLSVLLIGAIPYVLFNCIKSYMFAQGITAVQSHITIIALPIHIFFNYIFIVNPSTSIGFVGAPLSTALTYWVMFILIILYVVFINGHQAWGGWSKKSLNGWGPFFKMGLSSVIMTSSEWWAFEVMALGASYLGIVPLATYSVLMSLIDLFWNVNYGIAIITGNKAGNLIGESMVNKTIFIIRCALITSVSVSCLNISVILYFKQFLASLFTQDPEVIELSASIIPFVAYLQTFDGLATVGGFLLRGQGRHTIGAVINSFCFYLISIPLGFYLAFQVGMGLPGFCTAIAFTLMLTSSSLMYSAFSANWDEIIYSCKIRLNAENQSDL
jgi:MATE family multidrug resistance protein